MRCEISHLLADHLAIPLKYQAVKLLSVQMRLRLNHSPGQNNDITLSLFLLCKTSTETKDHLLIARRHCGRPYEYGAGLSPCSRSPAAAPLPLPSLPPSPPRALIEAARAQMPKTTWAEATKELKHINAFKS